jgi:VanZ family protein
MAGSRLQRIWILLGWGWVTLVIYLSLTASPPIPDVEPFKWDKFNHFLAYGWLMFWFAQIYHRTPARIGFALLFIAMGVGMEFLQGLGQTRHFEYADMLANTIGVLVGYVLTLGSLRFILSQIEHKWLTS